MRVRACPDCNRLPNGDHQPGCPVGARIQAADEALSALGDVTGEPAPAPAPAPAPEAPPAPAAPAAHALVPVPKLDVYDQFLRSITGGSGGSGTDDSSSERPASAQDGAARPPAWRPRTRAPGLSEAQRRVDEHLDAQDAARCAPFPSGGPEVPMEPEVAELRLHMEWTLDYWEPLTPGSKEATLGPLRKVYRLAGECCYGESDSGFWRWWGEVTLFSRAYVLEERRRTDLRQLAGINADLEDLRRRHQQEVQEADAAAAHAQEGEPPPEEHPQV